MTRRRVTDEQFSQLTRRTDELKLRVNEGVVPFDVTMDGLQKLIEGGKFNIFKTIKLGTGLKTAGGFLGALNDRGFRIRDSGKDILVRPDFKVRGGEINFKVSRREIEVDLVDISVIELGFKNGATLEEIHKRAIKRGFALCPPEVGPQLRLQYKDQPEDEQLFIAMEPITGSDSGVYMFYVEHDDSGLWLSGDGGGPAGFWRGGKRFLFLRRK